MVNNLFISLGLIVALMASLELVLYAIFGKNRPTKLFRSAATCFLVTAVSFSFIGQGGRSFFPGFILIFLVCLTALTLNFLVINSMVTKTPEPDHLRY